jgi:antitoxin ParD1/3/4
MKHLDLALPHDLDEYVQRRACAERCESAAEYVRELIRRDQRRTARESLEAALLQGLDDGPPIAMDADDWAEIRAAVDERLGSPKSS